MSDDDTATILLEKIRTGALAHGVVRLDCTAGDGSGRVAPSGEILIPANRLGAVAAELDAVVRRFADAARAEREKQKALAVETARRPEDARLH